MASADPEMQEDEEKFVEKVIAVSYDHYMSQLPTDNNVESCAFSDEINGLLSDRGMRHLIPILKESNVSLFTFLTFTEEGLREVGVRFSSDRRQILDLIKKFHLCHWDTIATLDLKSSKAAFYIGDGLLVMSRIVQQLYVEDASAAYLSMMLRETVQQMNAEEQQVYLTTLADRCREAVASAKILCKQMKSARAQAKKFALDTSPTPADFIGKAKPSEWSRKLTKTLFITSVIGIVVLWRVKLLKPSSFLSSTSSSLCDFGTQILSRNEIWRRL